MAEITVKLTEKQCDLIALALDSLLNGGKLNKEDSIEINELFCHFDALSEPEVPREYPKVTGIHLVWDRDSNIRPLFRK